MAKVMIRTGKPSSGGEVAEEEMLLTPNRTPIDRNMDLRDRLASLVGKGNNLSPDDRAAIFGDLATMLGKDKAQKIMQHTYVFNTRPDVQKLPLEEKLKSFYTIGSNDPDVMETITKTKNLGYGVLPGFRDSHSQINQQLSGAIPATDIVANNPEIQRKVMLKVKK